MADRTAQLKIANVAADDKVEAVVLLLHGGREVSTAPTTATQLAVLRMLPFAWQLRRLAPRRLAMARLRYRLRGWNAPDDGSVPGPVLDAEWALEQLASRFEGRPIGLIGHSMGGRTALRVAGHPSVRSVVGLAPWLPAGEPIEQMRERRVLLMHGTADRMTDPGQTAAYAQRLEQAGIAANLTELTGEKHAMLGRPRLWHRLADEFTVGALLPGSQTSETTQAPNSTSKINQCLVRTTY